MVSSSRPAAPSAVDHAHVLWAAVGERIEITRPGDHGFAGQVDQALAFLGRDLSHGQGRLIVGLEQVGARTESFFSNTPSSSAGETNDSIQARS